MATGFGPEGVVLMHLVSQIRPETIVFYLDTDLLFSHTYELRDELVKRLGIRFERVHSGISLPEQALRHGDTLWDRDPDTCCQIRKVIPQRQFLPDYQCLDHRHPPRPDRLPRQHRPGGMGLCQQDGQAQSACRVDKRSGLGTHPRHMTCLTTLCMITVIPASVAGPAPKRSTPGEDPRSGRWAGKAKTECGIHLPSMKKQ